MSETVYRKTRRLYKVASLRFKTNTLVSLLLYVQYSDNNYAQALSEKRLKQTQKDFHTAYTKLIVKIIANKAKIIYQPKANKTVVSKNPN